MTEQLPGIETLLVSYTLFPNVFPTEKTERADVPWEELVGKIEAAPVYIDKQHCPLVSMSEYGDRIDAGYKSLRYAANVQRVYGCEIDYDGERVSIDEAARVLGEAKIRAVLYTSPSHTPERPRWRVLLPFAEPTLPEKRAEYVGRANRILGGLATRESFTLSQSFYIGRVRGAQYEVRRTEGRTIDVACDIEPLYPAGSLNGGNGERDPTTDAELRASFEQGQGRYQAMLKLSARWAARGMSVDDIEAALDEMLGSGSQNADGIDLRTRIRPMAESAVRKYGETRAPKPSPKSDASPQEPEKKPPPGLRLVWSSLKGKEPPQREWIIPHWIPAAHVTLLSGRGGVGKSLLAQHIGAALAVGADFLEPLTPKRVLMWAAEDDMPELWRRQIGINSHFDTDFEKLEAFCLRSCVGCDVTLASPVFNALTPTPALTVLREECNDLKAELVILDNIARLFGGNENDRHQVTTFIAWVQAACTPAAVLLLGHPARAVGSEFSGSSAWEGAARARLYFSDRQPDQEVTDEFDVDPTVRYLSRRKANYSELDMRKLTLRDGMLIPDGRPRLQRSVNTLGGDFSKEVVRRAVLKLSERGIHGTLSTSSPTYLPKTICQYGLSENVVPRVLGATIRQMVLDGDLVTTQVGYYQNRTPKMGLTVPEMSTSAEHKRQATNAQMPK